MMERLPGCSRCYGLVAGLGLPGHYYLDDQNKLYSCRWIDTDTVGGGEIVDEGGG